MDFEVIYTEEQQRFREEGQWEALIDLYLNRIEVAPGDRGTGSRRAGRHDHRETRRGRGAEGGFVSWG